MEAALGGPSKVLSRPKALVCYICGREYGTKSLGIHLKSCKQKWEIEQMKLPPKQRRPMPQPPESFEQLMSGGVNSKKLDQYNEQAYNKWDTEALIACPNCQRTFLPDRLQIHLRSCKADRPLKPRLVSNKQTQEQEIRQKNIREPEVRVNNQQRQLQQKQQTSFEGQQRQSVPQSKVINYVNDGGSSGGSGGTQKNAMQQKNPAFFNNHKPNVNMMFTLDEEDNETEYGESLKSQINNPDGRIIKLMKKIQQSEDEEDIDEDYDDSDFEQDERFAKRQHNEFEDDNIIYQNIAKKEQKNLEQKAKRRVDNIQIAVKKINDVNDFMIPKGGQAKQTQQQVQQSERFNYPNPNDEDEKRVECSNCERRFAPDRIKKHEQTCQAQKQRKPFDVSKQRLGDHQEEVPQKQVKKKMQHKVIREVEQDDQKDDKKKKWKQQHEQLLKAIRISKKMKQLEDNGGDVREIQALASQIPNQNSEDLVECPHCLRKYSPKTAERHIPKCKDIVNKPKPPPRLRQQEQISNQSIISNMPQSQQQFFKNDQRMSVHGAQGSEQRPKSITRNKLPQQHYTTQDSQKQLPNSQDQYKFSNQGSPKLHSEQNLSKSPLKSILKNKQNTDTGTQQNLNYQQENLSNQSKSSSKIEVYQNTQKPGILQNSGMSGSPSKLDRKPLPKYEDYEGDEFDQYSTSNSRYDMPLQSPPQAIKQSNMFTPVNQGSRINSMLQSQTIDYTSRPSQVIEEKHANQANSQQEFNLLGSAGRRRISCYDNEGNKIEGSINQFSNDNILTKQQLHQQEEKKKVSFIRSHTPKPLKAKSIYNHNEEENDQGSKFLSPSRPQSSYLNNMNRVQQQTELNKVARHGDVKTRSSMYSNVQCPHCSRMFADAAAQRHIPICVNIKAKPKRLDQKSLNTSQIATGGIQPFKPAQQSRQNNGSTILSQQQDYEEQHQPKSAQKNSLNNSNMICQSFDHVTPQYRIGSPKALKIHNNRYGLPLPNLTNTADLGSTDSHSNDVTSLGDNLHNLLSPQTIQNLNKLNTPLMMKSSNNNNNDSSTNLSQASGSSLNSQAPKFCTTCGWKHRDVDRFCGGCGLKRV